MPDTEPATSTPQDTNPYRRTDILTGVTLGFGLLHHTDHVLRGNHSGWPFSSSVNEFTYSLAIYPVIGTGIALDAGPATWIVLDSVASVGLALAHTLIEPPHDQHDPWADGTNVVGVRSKALGRTSQVLSIGLSASLLAHLTSSIFDGMRCGFTWKRTSCEGPSGDAHFNITAGPSGSAGAGLRLRF